MPQENEARAGKPSDFIDDLFQDQDKPAPQGETDEGLEPGAHPDAEAVTVSLRKAAHGGEECVEIYAHGEAYPEDGREKTQQRVLLARVTEGALTMFPLVSASYRPAFLTPKYDELTTITILAEEDGPWWLPEDIREFDGMLESLPTGFGRHAKYGLGFKWEYRLIPHTILKVGGITELVMEAGRGASAEPPKFRLGIDRFTAIKRSIDAITTRARARSLHERRLLAFNELLHVADPARFERRYPDVKPGEIYELIQLRGRVPNRSAKDGIAAAQVVQEDAQKIASEEPSKLFELKAVIEQVTLAQLIGEFEAMMEKNLPEPKWQAFFKANPFILGLAFPYPVILFQDQASVGGTTIRGNGESIVDFLMAQQFTGNLAIVEIKRPSTALVEPKPYRGDLHAPHRDLSASMAQALDQRAVLLHHFAAKKSFDSTLTDAHVSSVNCIVIVGTLPKTPAQVRSLDLFRHSSKDIAVVAFDELLAKLKELHRLMSATTPAPAAPPAAPEELNTDLF